MRAALDDLDLARAAEYERRFRHDVMAHVHLFGDAAPAARGIIHLGATSAFIGDNTDLILHREALTLVRARIVRW
jgi:adenylosuccinate lyase